jgi:hypothetical protein
MSLEEVNHTNSVKIMVDETEQRGLDNIHISTPIGSPPGTPIGSPPGTPIGSPPGTPIGSPPGTPIGSPPGSPVGDYQWSPPQVNPNEESIEPDYEKYLLKKNAPQTNSEKLRTMISVFMNNNIKEQQRKHSITSELEVKFGTLSKSINELGFNQTPRLNKRNYDEVIKKLVSEGFTSNNALGVYRLGIQTEYNPVRGGKPRLSNIRVEVTSLPAIEYYCMTDSITKTQKRFPNAVTFTQKSIPTDTWWENQVDFTDFNFRASYKMENSSPHGIDKTLSMWNKVKKSFRLVNRVTYTHPKYLLKADISITKQNWITSETLVGAKTFSQPENYEVELELDNARIATELISDEDILNQLKKTIKFVMCGIQKTNYPVSYKLQADAIREYTSLIPKHDMDDTNKKRHTRVPFIGPSQYTLQMENISEINENVNVVNIRSDFVVTEKADGERQLMLIDSVGKIYFISSKMEVRFTGAITANNQVWNSLLDGEYISHDKTGTFINLYMAFDLYAYAGTNIRKFVFVSKPNSNSSKKSRYELLQLIMKTLHPESINGLSHRCPTRFDIKMFYPTQNVTSSQDTIFAACKTILDAQHMREYEIDGLIFTHKYFGVGAMLENMEGPPSNAPWEVSLKWKPANQNSIDFKVETIKTPSGNDIVHTRLNNGVGLRNTSAIQEYVTIKLNIGYNQKRDGYTNPCKDIISGKTSHISNATNNTNINVNADVSTQFFPSEPYDPHAGITNIELTVDKTNTKRMFSKDGDTFSDGDIVEFSYVLDAEQGWRWLPMRVRHDKTFSNNYVTANNNWRSVNTPITSEMITSGENIPPVLVNKDVYYNKTTTFSGESKTLHLKQFHNRYVKHKLITEMSSSENTLIDYACGKSGDLPKWIDANMSFVLGIDLSKDNIHNRHDGACARYLNIVKTTRIVPNALFVQGDSSKNIKSGAALQTDLGKEIVDQVFGLSPRKETIGPGILQNYATAKNGFDISSCQFAMHYFFKTPETLKGFLKNLAECTKLGGYFIGTAYDGNAVFNMLKPFARGHGDKIVEDGKKVWEISKDYDQTTFVPDQSSLGYEIQVYQESINQHISEYLVNFEYFNTMMERFGFQLADKTRDLGDKTFSSGSGLFSSLFYDMEKQVKETNKNKTTKFNKFEFAQQMSNNEKKISFLNRYVIYRKIRNVDIDNEGNNELPNFTPMTPTDTPPQSIEYKPMTPTDTPPQSIEYKPMTPTDTPPQSIEHKPMTPTDTPPQSIEHKQDEHNWVNEFMKNNTNSYGIIDNEGCGDCLFASFRDALKTVQVIKSVQEMREIISNELTQDQFENYKTLYEFHKQEVATITNDISDLNNQITQLKQQTLKLGKSKEDKKQKADIRSQALKLQTKKTNLKSEKNIANYVVKTELAFMKSASSLEKLKTIIKTPLYWADGWAITTLEQVLNIKVILMSSKAFEENNLQNVITCGESINKSVFTPDHYIILDYTGIHYKLITYNGKRIFTFAEIPSELKNKIRTLCLRGESGAFRIIPDFTPN